MKVFIPSLFFWSCVGVSTYMFYGKSGVKWVPVAYCVIHVIGTFGKK